MAIFGVGIDVIDVERIRRSIRDYGTNFLNRIYTKEEISYCESFKEKKHLHYAARFAAKEALIKALGINKISFKDIEIVKEKNKRPVIKLSHKTLARKRLKFHLSLSHIDNYACAIVVIEV